jgi:prepilin-type N-terminal cleavage/methylation domain-containing protein
MKRPTEGPAAGFTLIELLIVVMIMVLLMGMLLPIVGIARRNAQRSAATAMMTRIDTALRVFRADAGHLPWTPTPAATDGPWGNDLAYRLTHVPTAADHAALVADLAAVSLAYAPGGPCAITYNRVDQPANTWSMAGPTALAAGVANLAGGADTRAAAAACIDRMAIERGRVAVLCGNTGIARTLPNAGQPWSDGAAIIAHPLSRGLTDDYLAGELPPQQVRGDAIIDPWGNPYVYFCPVVNGVIGYVPQAVNQGQIVASWFGLQMRTRTATTAMDSDLRTQATAAEVADFELWSAGPDGRFSSHRSDAVDNDNLSVTPYLRGLQ